MLGFWNRNRQLLIGFAFGVVCTIIFNLVSSSWSTGRYSYFDLRAVGERTYERMKAEDEARRGR